MTFAQPGPEDPRQVAVHDAVPEDVYGSWSASPSPDGGRVAFVSDRSGEPRVWIHERGGASPTLVTPAPDRVLTVSWSPDGAWLACEVAASGASRTQVWLMRPDGSDLHLAAGAGLATATLAAGPWHGWSADAGLLVTETSGEESHALLVEPAGGRRRVLASGRLITLLGVSAAADRALLRVGPRGARSVVVLDADGTRHPLAFGSGVGSIETGSIETGSIETACLSPDGRTVYARSDFGRDLAALVSADVSGPAAARVLAEHDEGELSDLVLSGDGSTVVLVWNVDGGCSRVTLLDLASGRERTIERLPRAVVDECRLAPDGSTLLLTAEDWADPRGVWEIDLDSGAATPLSSPGGRELRASLGASTPVVEAEDLTRPELRRLPARDSLALTGWLYRPAGAPPWPTVVYLHGGPEAQERPVYNSLFQSLVAAGIAVFAPNVRGSSGFGRAFLVADDREKRFAAIDDVAACVEHLVSSGVADPERVACMGRSYGGYLTLAALVEHPHLFAAGVDVCGMADFATFYAHTERWIAAAAVAEYGDPVRDAHLLRALSPIHRIDRLVAPLLVVHGADDTNVPVEEAEQVVAALAARGVEHEYLLFEGEGHELLATPNRVAFVQATVAWLTRHLRLDALTSRAVS
jgi:dipeptidyl aminopeptidase/acylaminoacyl peptidase